MKDANDGKSSPAYLRYSDAMAYLAKGMSGGMSRPRILNKPKKEFPNLSIGFGPWSERAGRRLADALINHELPAYIALEYHDRVANSGHESDPSEPHRIVVLPKNFLKGEIPTSRGVLSDHLIRPTHKKAKANAINFELLKTGILLVRKDEFIIWYRTERAKGKWPSQRTRSKPSNGRPSKQTAQLRKAILNHVDAGRWDGSQKITVLYKLLRREQSNLPSTDTLCRAVDQLYAELGDARLRRKKQRRRRRI
jgi:hypothetical protein